MTKNKAIDPRNALAKKTKWGLKIFERRSKTLLQPLESSVYYSFNINANQHKTKMKERKC